jgi:hypothetical protein
MPEHLPDLTALLATSQALLVDFLETELSLGFTFLQTAAIEVGDEPAACNRAISNACAALETIRGFQGRVVNPAAWKNIQDRANSLESDIRAFLRTDPLPGIGE